MRKYETIIVIDSLLKAEEIEGIITKYERFISANGGTIDAIDRWGKRRIAYEIKKRQYGYYVLIRFEAQPAMIKQLDREYRLNEFLLRTMTTKLDKKALAALAKQPMLPPVAVEHPDLPEPIKLDLLTIDEPKEIKEITKEPIEEKPL